MGSLAVNITNITKIISSLLELDALRINTDILITNAEVIPKFANIAERQENSQLENYSFSDANSSKFHRARYTRSQALILTLKSQYCVFETGWYLSAPCITPGAVQSWHAAACGHGVSCACGFK